VSNQQVFKAYAELSYHYDDIRLMSKLESYGSQVEYVECLDLVSSYCRVMGLSIPINTRNVPRRREHLMDALKTPPSSTVSTSLIALL
jgi:hypothetical protein